MILTPPLNFGSFFQVKISVLLGIKHRKLQTPLRAPREKDLQDSPFPQSSLVLLQVAGDIPAHVPGPCWGGCPPAVAGSRPSLGRTLPTPAPVALTQFLSPQLCSPRVSWLFPATAKHFLTSLFKAFFHWHGCLDCTKGRGKVGQPFFPGCFQSQWDCRAGWGTKSPIHELVLSPRVTFQAWRSPRHGQCKPTLVSQESPLVFLLLGWHLRSSHPLLSLLSRTWGWRGSFPLRTAFPDHTFQF